MSSVKLESWIHDVIEHSRQNDESFRCFRNSKRTNQRNRRTVETYRDFNLQRTLSFVYEKSFFYRKQFEACGLKPEDIQGFEQLSKFPLTDPQQLSEFPDHFLCTSQSEVVRPCIFVTSGTTGSPKKIYWSLWDLERITNFMAAGISTVASPQDTVQILLPHSGPDSQADLLRKGVEKLGAKPLVTGVALNSVKQLKTLEEFHSTILFGYAGHIFRLSKELQHDYDLSTKGVKVLFLAGEYLPTARRIELESIWNCSVRTHYGLTEMGLGVAVECDAGDGYHFNEADLLLEIIHPATGKRVLPGEEGELVFTTLTRQAMPLIRYRTRDISSFVERSCGCGANSLLKIATIKKRLDAIVKLKSGVELYPTVFDDLIYSFPNVVDYQVILSHKTNRERLGFTIEVTDETEDLPGRICRSLHEMPVIADSMAAGTMDAPLVKGVPMGRLKSVERAKKLIIDDR